MNKPKQTPEERDRHLDIPSEANRDKHINFRELDESGRTADVEVDKETKERRRRWQQGIAEGTRNKKA